MHDPPYLGATHRSTITARVDHEPLGVAAIDIEVVVGELTDCSEFGGSPSLLPCRRSAHRVVHRCRYAGRPEQAACRYVHTLGPGRLVSYRAVLWPVGGTPLTSNEVSHAGGAPPSQQQPLALPVRWERAAHPARRIDLGLFPDPAYTGGAADFAADLRRLLAGAFHGPGPLERDDRRLPLDSFNLWTSPPGAEAQGCVRRFQAGAAQVAAVLDGQAILHRGRFDDCAAMALGGAGSVWTGDDHSAGRLLHQGAHFLFALQEVEGCDEAAPETAGGGHASDKHPSCSAAAEDMQGPVGEGCQRWKTDRDMARVPVPGSAPARAHEGPATGPHRACTEQRLTRCASSTCY
ncbi:hypothetical protein [Eleftheria terrae]|uniref:hypothetical protein n=1 Tax=Eleftheria terrae TaxID=1597781 RepID=UPI00263B18BA|nr:hypothetical protein [Eleftheria terrae]WKB52793.1 hypothetical protein N7L95_23950 [Eleftheria terrae]